MTEKHENFEESLAKLEAILHRLETEEVPLEEMLTLYEEGVRLSKACRTVLEKAHKKLELITDKLEEDDDKNSQ
jgi:exodeoxyribonuclease VII small subunit